MMTPRKGKRRHLPPSRQRYEASHPTVSVRIPRELREELEELKQTAGLSMADILKAGLDKLKPDIEEIYDKAYGEGYAKAEEEYKVLVKCYRCGRRHLAVTGDRIKAAVDQALTGWYSPDCR